MYVLLFLIFANDVLKELKLRYIFTRSSFITTAIDK